MASTEEMRNYRFLDATLCQFTSDLCNTLTRDLADLTPFGITAPKITALKATATEMSTKLDSVKGKLNGLIISWKLSFKMVSQIKDLWHVRLIWCLT